MISILIVMWNHVHYKAFDHVKISKFFKIGSSNNNQSKAILHDKCESVDNANAKDSLQRK